MSSMGCSTSTSNEVRFADKDAKSEAPAAQHGTVDHSQGAIFSGLALKFPLVKRAFINVKKVFDSFAHDNKSSEITADKLGQVMSALGAQNLSQQEIQNLFHRSDLDNSKMMSFREFFIAVALGYYLKDDVPDSQKGPHFEENRKGFKVIQTAFQKIDKDNGGSVDPEELKSALFETATSDSSKEILEARFKELDFNSDGDIEFPEFIYGFTAWVGMSGDDDEDEAEDDVAEANTAANAHVSD